MSTHRPAANEAERGTRAGGFAPSLTAPKGNWASGFSFPGIKILLETVPQTKVGVGVVFQLPKERRVVAQHDVGPRGQRHRIAPLVRE